MTHNLKSLLSLAIHAAEDACRLIAASRDTPFEVEHKQDADTLAAQVVTEVDRAAEALIRDHLMPTVAPGKLGFLGEESDDDGSRFSCEAFWCIDPIDGTLPFVEGNAGFATSIALVARDGSPLIGVVADPVAGDLWAVARGLGATRNGKAFTASSTGEAFHVFADRSFRNHPRFADYMAAMGQISGELNLGPVVLDMQAGAVLNAMKVLEKGPACYCKLRRPTGGGSLWDYAATACFYAELGLPATDLDGRPFELNRAESTSMNHRGVVYASGDGIAEAVRLAFG